jgi:uncharacterized membrane protein
MLVLLTVSYPFVVYFGLQNWSASTFAAFLLVIAALRWLSPNLQMGPRYLWVGLLILIAALVWAFEQKEYLKIYPILVNLSFLALFTHSYFKPPTIIERLARISEPDLPEEGVRYTRQVTLLWMGFFIINGSLAAITGLWGSNEVWLIYNGFISYFLMALLFTGEWLVRRVVRRTHG